MATGKTNARWVRFLIDDSGATARDVSASVTNISGVGLSYGETDVTAYSDGVRNFTLGHAESQLDVTGTFNNTATTGAHTVFKDIAGQQSATVTVTVQIGIRAAPTTGDPEFEGEYYCSSYLVNGDGTWTARVVPGSGTAPAWTTVS